MPYLPLHRELQDKNSYSPYTIAVTEAMHPYQQDKSEDK